MSDKTKELISLVDILPEKEQDFIGEVIKRFILAWDPDFTKVTPQERERIRQAEVEFERGETVSMDEIKWD